MYLKLWPFWLTNPQDCNALFERQCFSCPQLLFFSSLLHTSVLDLPSFSHLFRRSCQRASALTMLLSSGGSAWVSSACCCCCRQPCLWPLHTWLMMCLTLGVQGEDLGLWGRSKQLCCCLMTWRQRVDLRGAWRGEGGRRRDDAAR